MPENANELVDLRIDFVSLVCAGANRREFILKGEDEVGFDVRAEIRKVDAERRWVTGVLYPAGEVDTQGDFAKEATLDAAMVGFMAKGKTASGRACDVDHDGQATADAIVECYKIEAGDPRWPDERDAGAWVVTRLVVDDDLWAAVERGDYKAFSFGGVAKRVPNQPVSKTGAPAVAVTRSLPPFRDVILRGVFADTLARMRNPQLIDATVQALWHAFYGAGSPEEEVAELQSVLEDAMAEFAKAEEPAAPPVAPSRLDRLRALLGRSPAAEKAAHAAAMEALSAKLAAAEKARAELEAETALAAAEKADADAAGDALLAEALAKVDTLELALDSAKAEAAAAEEARATAAAELEKVMTASPGSGRLDINTPPEPEGVTVKGGIFAS